MLSVGAMKRILWCRHRVMGYERRTIIEKRLRDDMLYNLAWYILVSCWYIQ